MINRSPEKVEQMLNKVLESKEFSSSATCRQLFSYLVESSLNGEHPKETSIAIDVFDKDSSYDPAKDSIVRSYMHILRKKLNTFYLTEGRNEKVRFHLPKGRYEILTREVDKKENNPYKIATLALSGFVLILLVVIGMPAGKSDKTSPSRSFEASEQYFSTILDDSAPVLIVLGDYYFFNGGKTYYGSDAKVRFGIINSDEDLTAYLEKFPEKQGIYRPSNHRYVTNSLLFSLPPLFQLFHAHGKEVNIQFSSYIDKDILLENHVIFLGPAKTLGFFQNELDKLNLEYQHYPHRLNYQAGEQNMEALPRKVMEGEYYYRTGYSLVTRQPGLNGNTLMIFTAFSSGSVSRTIDYLLSESFYSTFQTDVVKNNQTPENFAMLFEVTRLESDDFVTLKQYFPFKKDQLYSVNETGDSQ